MKTIKQSLTNDRITLALTRAQAHHLQSSIHYWLQSVRLEFSSEELSSEELESIEAHKEVQRQLVAFLADKEETHD